MGILNTHKEQARAASKRQGTGNVNKPADTQPPKAIDDASKQNSGGVSQSSNFWEKQAQRDEERKAAFDKNVGIKVNAPASQQTAPTASSQPTTPTALKVGTAAPSPTPTAPTTPAAPSGGTNAIVDITSILGKSPEQKAIEEEKLRRANQSKQMVAGLFDALRYLGMAAGGGFSGIPVPQLSDTAAYLRGLQEKDKADRDRLDAESAAYKMKVYQMNKEAREKARQEEEAQEAKEYNRSRQKAADERAEAEHQQKLKTEQARENYIKTQEKYLSGKPYSTKTSSSEKTAERQRAAQVKKEADQWGRSYKTEAKQWWSSHERSTENEEAFNKMMRKKYAKKQGKGKSSSVKQSSSSSSSKSRKLKE